MVTDENHDQVVNKKNYFQTDYKQTKEKSKKISYTICRQNGKISIIIKIELRKKVSLMVLCPVTQRTWTNFIRLWIFSEALLDEPLDSGHSEYSYS